MGENLKSKALSGAFYTFSAQGVRLIGQIVSLAILARYVNPVDFGMIGILISITAFLQLFRDLGIPMAIVQKEEIGKGELITLHRFALILGVSMIGLVSLCGVVLAYFVDEPRLVHVAPLYGICFFLASYSLVPLALLRRQMCFGLVAKCEIAGFLSGLVISIALAVWGWGYWALVAVPVVTSLVLTVLIRKVSTWDMRSEEVLPMRSVISYIKFGGAMTIGEIANYLCKHLDNILIGKIWGMAALGFYTRAYSLMVGPMQQALSPLGAVLMPVLSRLNSDEAEFRKWAKKLCLYAVILAAPLSAFFFVTASDIVFIMLGGGWEETAEILMWLSFSLFSRPVASVLYWIFLSSGNVRGLMKWNLINAVITILAMVAGVIFGPVYVAAAYSLSGCLIRTPIAIWFAAQTKKVSFGQITWLYAGALLLLVGCGCLLFGLDYMVASYGPLSGLRNSLGSLTVGTWFPSVFSIFINVIALVSAIGLLLGLTPFGRRMVSDLRSILKLKKGANVSR